ncbi:MAG TPA: hypothetical protein VFA02_01915 [Pseudacidobacterium sp.]|nr:hypothetical protein [Pseudacidobacterium sp.]
MRCLKQKLWLTGLLVLLCVLPARAHVGSPDVYAQGDAGPYKLFVVVRPPLVIPGVAEIQVRAQTPGVESITAAPMLLTGEASKHPPVPDTLTKSPGDPQFFTGKLWIMATGSWQVRFVAHGDQGQGVFSVPLPATALGTRKMSLGLGFLLAVLGAVLVLGIVGIIGAAAREAQLKPGEKVPAATRNRAWVAMAVTFVLLISAVVLGGMWWRAEAADYSSYIYKPLQMQAVVQPDHVLELRLKDPGWLSARKLDDFVPDHNHLMHLYAIRWPAMDVVYHVHPQQTAAGDFQLALPDMPAGTYRLYADVVHANGFPETLTSTVTVPEIHGKALSGDDSMGKATPAGTENAMVCKLSDGYTMVWKRPAALKANAAEDFTFQLLDPQGQAPKDMALYMGMAGHAAFVKTDGTVFAHIHPSGTVSMAALMMAEAQNPSSHSQMMMPDMPGMDMSGGNTPVSNTVSFPYGFPRPGNYRIFVQMKHGSVIETGTFDASVE